MLDSTNILGVIISPLFFVSIRNVQNYFCSQLINQLINEENRPFWSVEEWITFNDKASRSHHMSQAGCSVLKTEMKICHRPHPRVVYDLRTNKSAYNFFCQKALYKKWSANTEEGGWIPMKFWEKLHRGCSYFNKGGSARAFQVEGRRWVSYGGLRVPGMVPEWPVSCDESSEWGRNADPRLTKCPVARRPEQQFNCNNPVTF